jgi:hypothetical protein
VHRKAIVYGPLVRKQVPVDLELVQFAMEDRDGEAHWFLDTDTGEVVRASEDDDELREQIEEGFAERYIGIPHQGSDAGYRDGRVHGLGDRRSAPGAA